MNLTNFSENISKISGYPSDIKNLIKIFSHELEFTPVVESGLDNEGDPYIILENEKQFFGLKNSIYDSTLYHLLRKKVREKINKQCLRVFRDIIFRYNYPHMRPDITPDYSLQVREKYFHPQHRDTISDIPELSDSARQNLITALPSKLGSQ